MHAGTVDINGTSVQIGDLLLTSRGELLTALESDPSIWSRGAGIAVEDRKHVKTYRPASMLVKVSAELVDGMGPIQLTGVWVKLTETTRELRRSELRERRGFK